MRASLRIEEAAVRRSGRQCILEGGGRAESMNKVTCPTNLNLFLSLALCIR